MLLVILVDMVIVVAIMMTVVVVVLEYQTISITFFFSIKCRTLLSLVSQVVEKLGFSNIQSMKPTQTVAFSII